jgi:drug/metabolite transporter (DMT)-like permease
MSRYKRFGSTDIFMLLVVLFWALNFSFIKIALREISPLGFNGIRLFLAALILLLVFFGSKEKFSISKSDIWLLVGLSLIGNTAFQLVFIHGLNWTTASNTSIVMAMTPIVIAIMSSFLKHERIHWAAWLGILASFIGFYLVIGKQAGFFHFSWQSIKGDFLILLGNICWAVYTVFSKPLLDKMSPLKLTAITLPIGTFFYLPFCINDLVKLQWKTVSIQAWGALVYSALVALVASYIIWYSSVKRVGNVKTSIYGNITPIFTMIFAFFLISERVTFFQVVGAMIIFGGVYLTRSGYRLFEKKMIGY